MRDERLEAQEQIREALTGLNGSDQQRIAEEGLKWLATILRKNRDYGSSAWTAPVCAPHLPAKSAILVRMSDKVRRIGALSGGTEAAVKSESLRDSIGDLGAYCLLFLICPD